MPLPLVLLTKKYVSPKTSVKYINRFIVGPGDGFGVTFANVGCGDVVGDAVIRDVGLDVTMGAGVGGSTGANDGATINSGVDASS